MSSLSLFVKDADFSNNLRSLVELAKFVAQRVLSAHRLQPVRAARGDDAAFFDGVKSHEELEYRLRQREQSHLHAIAALRAEI